MEERKDQGGGDERVINNKPSGKRVDRGEAVRLGPGQGWQGPRHHSQRCSDWTLDSVNGHGA